MRTPFYYWPAYTYTRAQVLNIDAHFCHLLKTIHLYTSEQSETLDMVKDTAHSININILGNPSDKVFFDAVHSKITDYTKYFQNDISKEESKHDTADHVYIANDKTYFQNIKATNHPNVHIDEPCSGHSSLLSYKPLDALLPDKTNSSIIHTSMHNLGKTIDTVLKQRFAILLEHMVSSLFCLKSIGEDKTTVEKHDSHVGTFLNINGLAPKPGSSLTKVIQGKQQHFYTVRRLILRPVHYRKLYITASKRCHIVSVSELKKNQHMVEDVLHMLLQMYSDSGLYKPGRLSSYSPNEQVSFEV